MVTRVIILQGVKKAKKKQLSNVNQVNALLFLGLVRRLQGGAGGRWNLYDWWRERKRRGMIAVVEILSVFPPVVFPPRVLDDLGSVYLPLPLQHATDRMVVLPLWALLDVPYVVRHLDGAQVVLGEGVQDVHAVHLVERDVTTLTRNVKEYLSMKLPLI